MIPLSVPNISGNEWQYVKECLDTGWVSSVGSYVNKFEDIIKDYTGAKFAIATSNGTSALHIALQLSGVQAGDWVICPNITFVASANSISYCGAKPLLIDIEEDTWQMDLKLLKKYLQKNTEIINNECVIIETGEVIRAIMPVHILGHLVDIKEVLKIAEEFHLKVVEDSTEALGSFLDEKHAGTFGQFGTLSFNGNKILTTGGGGIIMTNDEDLAKKAKHLTTQAKASVSEYFHDETGYNYRLVNILAAIGVAQMEQLPEFLKVKKRISERYLEAFKDDNNIIFQKQLFGSKPNNWLYTIRVNDKNGLIGYLKENQIEARPFWVPMNSLPMFKDSFYVSEKDFSHLIYDSCVSIPCSTSLSPEDQEQVILKIFEFYGKN
ncbi:MAG: LegC family aminotransferase [Bacteroidetes bacterium]|nr:LegC family aminotransferase [Bacteroidota bacterium]